MHEHTADTNNPDPHHLPQNEALIYKRISVLRHPGPKIQVNLICPTPQGHFGLYRARMSQVKLSEDEMENSETFAHKEENENGMFLYCTNKVLGQSKFPS